MSAAALGLALFVLGAEPGTDIPPLPKSQCQAAPKGMLIERPVWVRRPKSDDLLRYYPLRRPEGGQDGAVQMQCRVTRDGRLLDCRVMHVAPPGTEFAGATLKLARYFQMAPCDEAGRSVAGRPVRVTVKWTLE